MIYIYLCFLDTFAINSFNYNVRRYLYRRDYSQWHWIGLSITTFVLFDFRFGIVSFVLTMPLHTQCTIVDRQLMIVTSSKGQIFIMVIIILDKNTFCLNKLIYKY
jgi:hypothetical protein